MKVYKETTAMEIEDSDIIDGVLNIPEGIERIMIRFAKGKHKDNVKTVVLPSTLISIGSFAFSECKKLEIVDCSKCKILRKIEGKAFFNCSKLNTFNFAYLNILEEIGKETFAGTALSSIGFSPETGPLVIQERVFSNCHKLMSANLGWRLTRLESYCFNENEVLQRVGIFSNDELTIEEFAFNNCQLLTEFHYYGTLMHTSENAFENCPEFILATNKGRYTLPDTNIDTISLILVEDNL